MFLHKRVDPWLSRFRFPFLGQEQIRIAPDLFREQAVFSFGQDARGNERKSRTILRLRGLEHQAGGPGYPLIDRGQGYVKREPAFFIGYLPLGEPPVRQSIRRILSGQDHDIYCEIPGSCLKST